MLGMKQVKKTEHDGHWTCED